MKKLPYIRQGQQLTIDILNGIIKAINSSILERKEYDSMMADITRMFNSYQSKVDNFILKYQDVVDNTPGLMDLLQSYSTLASMVNGTYVASVGSVNITAAGFNIQDTMTRSDFETVSGEAERYEQYSSLLITEDDGETTLVYNVAPLESTPIWIEIDKIAGPQGPPGPQGIPGPSGENGENGRDGQITSIKGKVASLDECLDLDDEPLPGDAYVVEGDNDEVALYVYVGGNHAEPSSWVTLNNIRGPAGAQGKMAEIRIQYSNNYDGSSPSSSYNGQSFLVLTEEGKSDPHIIQISPKLKFEIVDIEESNEATIPSAEHTYIYTRASNEHKIKTKITIPTLKTVESASLVNNKDLHLQYRGTAGTTNVGRVVYDPSKIIFMNSLADFSISTVREGDVIINTADYSIYNVVAGTPKLQGSLQGPQGPAGPVGASFSLVGEWVTYGNTSNGEVTAWEGNVGKAYFLPADDGDHKLGLYVSSETSPGVYGWVFAGNSEGPQGEPGETGPIGPRGSRITSGEEFYLDDNRVPCAPLNPDNAYQQGDLYLNTATWDLFRVEQIDPAPDYTILPSHIGNIKGEGITDIAFNSAAETLTITYSGGRQTTVHIETIHVSSAEYGEVGLVVHKTDGSDKGVFAIDYTIGEQSDPAVPASFNLWGDETHLKAPSGTTGSAGISPLIPRADHVHPAPATATSATTATNLSSGERGSVPYQTAAGTTGFIGPNKSTTKKFLSQTGTGSEGALPAWGTLTTSDITDFGDIIETSQSTSAVKVPSSKLLKESSFARVYRSFADLGIPNSSTIAELHSAMIDRSRAIISVSTYDYVAYRNTGLELPNNLFYVLEAIRSDNERLTLKLVGKASNSAVLYQYEGMYWKYGDTNKFTGWKQILTSPDSIETTQSTSTVKVPSSKLLRESSFARVYREVTEIPGITEPVAIGDLVKAIMDANLVNCYFCIGMNTSTETKVTGLPVIGTAKQTYGTLTIITGSSALRMRIEYNREIGNDNTLMWIGSINRGTTPYTVTWKQIIDDRALANPTILGNGDFFRNDNGAEVYSSPVASCINQFGFGLTQTTGSYNATTRTLKSDTFEAAGKYAFLYQYIDNPARLNGKVVTLSAKVASTNCYWLIQLWKTIGGTTTALATSTIDSTLSRSVSVTIPSGTFAAGDKLRAIIQTYGETDLDYIKLEIGSLATAYTPTPEQAVDSLRAVYDKVIKTQAEFEDMIADGLALNDTNIQNSTWRGAKSVALIGDQFELYYTDNCGVKIPDTVKQIHGFNGAKITITNFKYNASTGLGGLWYETKPTTQDYSIRDLEVSCTSTGTTAGYGFTNCINLSNCTGTGASTGTGNGYGFFNCINLSNCKGTGTGASTGRGFYYCNNLSNCIGTGTGATAGYGFYECNYLSNCIGKGVDSGNASDGFGFFEIDYAVNCKDGDSSTNMWGGTNRNIDLDTCRKTPVQVTTAELTALNT